MKRETAEHIVEVIGDYFSNLYSEGYDRSDMSEHAENVLIDEVLKIAAAGEKIFVHNPVTGKDYAIVKRSAVNPDAKKIRGLWSKPEQGDDCKQETEGK